MVLINENNIFLISSIFFNSVLESFVEINFNSEKNKTLKFTFTPKSKYDKAVDELYNVLIKNIDNNNNTISFYLTKIGNGFKEPLRENPIWTLKQNLTTAFNELYKEIKFLI